MTAAHEGQAGLAAELHAAGYLPEPWLPVFNAVDRAAFLADRVWVRASEGYRPVRRGADPEAWRAAVYSDTPIITQVSDIDGPGDVAFRPTSSASMPRMVARMLDALDVRAGTRVLEADTGTGYNAALLCHRLGDDAVTTVDVDPAVSGAARTALHGAGYDPSVVVGDGSQGHPARGPYDRTIATYAVDRVPWAWVEQTRPGGLLVTPWGTGLYNGVLLCLTVAGDETASGRVIGDSAFMWDRGAAPSGEVMDVVHGTEGQAEHTELDPRHVLGIEDMAFTAGLLVPGTRYSVGHGDVGRFTLWLADAASGSWASVDYEPDTTVFETEQCGPRSLWDEVEAAYKWWVQAGSPKRTRFGLTVGPSGQRAWLDTPDRPVPVPGADGAVPAWASWSTSSRPVEDL